MVMPTGLYPLNQLTVCTEAKANAKRAVHRYNMFLYEKDPCR